MKIAINNTDADMVSATADRSDIDGKANQMSDELRTKISERPHILLRRQARWARRASYV